LGGIAGGRLAGGLAGAQAEGQQRKNEKTAINLHRETPGGGVLAERSVSILPLLDAKSATKYGWNAKRRGNLTTGCPLFFCCGAV
jgi:hypothetical protein